MLLTMIVAVIAFAVLFAAMAVGVLLSNKPVKGSCGGLGAVGLDGECEICGGDRGRCRDEKGGGQQTERPPDSRAVRVRPDTGRPR